MFGGVSQIYFFMCHRQNGGRELHTVEKCANEKTESKQIKFHNVLKASGKVISSGLIDG